MTQKYTIVNVVATSILDQPVDLEHLRKRFPKYILWDQDIYGGRVAYFKTENMEGKVSIFWSGKLISVGTKSIDKAVGELELTAKTLKAELKTQPKIQSIVATADFGAPIDLESFITKIQNEKHFHVIYEPEQFPGAIIKFPLNKKAKATILLFATGKLVCVGLTKPEQIQKAIKMVKLKLKE